MGLGSCSVSCDTKRTKKDRGNKFSKTSKNLKLSSVSGGLQNPGLI